MKTYSIPVPLADLMAGGYVPQKDDVITAVDDCNDEETNYFEVLGETGLVYLKSYSTQQWDELLNDPEVDIEGRTNRAYAYSFIHCYVYRPAVLVADLTKETIAISHRENLFAVATKFVAMILALTPTKPAAVTESGATQDGN